MSGTKSDLENRPKAEIWIVRGPKGHGLFGPFNHPKEAQTWATNTWPDESEILEDGQTGWEVEPLYPPDIQVAGAK